MSAEWSAPTLATPTLEDLDRARAAATEARSSLAHSVMTHIKATGNLSDYSRGLAVTAIEADTIADRTFGEWWHNALTAAERARVLDDTYFQKYGHRCVLCADKATA